VRSGKPGVTPRLAILYPSVAYRVWFGTVALGALALSGCSIKKYAINQVGDVLASGGSVFENDSDIELVGDALPFSLKLVESLIAESPKHRGLLLTAARGYTVYSYGFVHFDAEVRADDDLDEARRLRERARDLYLRGHGYGIRGLDLLYPRLGQTLSRDPEGAIRLIGQSPKKDVFPLLYWTAASLGLAISAAKNDASLLARVPEVEALLDRALELDESWDQGTLHEFSITLAGAKGGDLDLDSLRAHYERALVLSNGKRASLFLAYAETVSVPSQNAREFRDLLNRALAVDLDSHPELRLSNALAHRRARWLLERIDELFLEPDSSARP
jgi:predicted anti-sigma-YlaC factor YlaD